MCRILYYEREKYEIFYSVIFIKGTHSGVIGVDIVDIQSWGEMSSIGDINPIYSGNDSTMIFMKAAPDSWSSITLSVATLDILTENDFSDFQMGGLTNQ